MSEFYMSVSLDHGDDDELRNGIMGVLYDLIESEGGNPERLSIDQLDYDYGDLKVTATTKRE